MKRRVFRLYCAANGMWSLTEGGKNVAELLWYFRRKDDAERTSRRLCRFLWKNRRQPCQLLIYTKAGRIGKGGRYEASYGCNSKKRKG